MFRAACTYTAPDKITDGQVVVVTAVSKKDSKMVGRAMALVYETPATTALTVSPGELILTAGQQYSFMIADQSGQAVTATCTLTPNVGKIEPDAFKQGQWKYTAPDKITTSTQVTVSAVKHGDTTQQGQATVKLAPAVAVTLNTQHEDSRCGCFG